MHTRCFHSMAISWFLPQWNASHWIMTCRNHVINWLLWITNNKIQSFGTTSVKSENNIMSNFRTFWIYNYNKLLLASCHPLFNCRFATSRTLLSSVHPLQIRFISTIIQAVLRVSTNLQYSLKSRIIAFDPIFEQTIDR